MKISIIMPVYNTEKYLERSIKSVLKYLDAVQLIIVDDGSTDGSIHIIESFSKEYNKNIVVIRKENGGLSDARNVGLEHCDGEYIVWLDSDDCLTEESISQLLYIIENFNPEVIVNRISSFIEDKNIIVERPYIFPEGGIVNRKEAINILSKTKGFWFSAWSFVTEKDFLIKNNLYFQKGIFHEDELWSPLVVSCADRFYFNNKSIYINTANRQGSITTKPNIKKSYDKLFIAQKLFEKSSITSKECKKFFRRRIAILLYRVYCEIKSNKISNEYRDLKKCYKKTLVECFGYKRFIYRVLFMLLWLIGKK